MPMGFMPLPCRIWCAARRSIVATWSRTAAGFWETAAAGPSALRVALHRLMRAEAAVRMGIHAAGVCYDAANVYDNVSLDQLIERAERSRCPLRPLAIPIQMRVAPRTMLARGLVSDMLQPAISAMAGCGQAADLARPPLHGVLDAAHVHNAFVVLQQYLGDLALQVEGARKAIVPIIANVARVVK